MKLAEWKTGPAEITGNTKRESLMRIEPLWRKSRPENQLGLPHTAGQSVHRTNLPTKGAGGTEN